jgi:hypothetical protein
VAAAPDAQAPFLYAEVDMEGTVRHRHPCGPRVAVLVMVVSLGLAAGAETYTNRGVGALFAGDHGGEVHDCPAWVSEIFPGRRPPACLTLDAENVALARGMLDRTVDEVAGIDWTGRWDAFEGGDPRQMVHRELAIGDHRFLVTLRLAGPSPERREVLVVIQRSG